MWPEFSITVRKDEGRRMKDEDKGINHNSCEQPMITLSNPGPIDLRTRTKQYALRIIRLYSALPTGVAAQVMGKQLLRAGTSVGAHYREASRAPYKNNITAFLVK